VTCRPALPPWLLLLTRDFDAIARLVTPVLEVVLDRAAEEDALVAIEDETEDRTGDNCTDEKWRMRARRIQASLRLVKRATN